jgi:hypothetical protein
MEYRRSAVVHMDLAIKVWVFRKGVSVSVSIRVELLVEEMSDKIRKRRLTEVTGEFGCSTFAYC